MSAAPPIPSERAPTPAAGYAYQPPLDGVRGLAVLAVLLYHAQVTWASGGFLGVDAFFVLSGYLITSLMLAELRVTGRLDLPAFWLRRARRLLPALFLVLIAVAAFAAFAATRDQISGLRGDGISTLFYFANWRQVFLHHSYFDLFRTPSMLQHTWSLAIEEQWYVVWPLVLPLLVRWTRARPGRLLTVIGALAAASAVLMGLLYHPGHDPSRVYYGTDTRAQSLLIGAGLAVLLLWRPGPRTAATRAVLQASALGAVAFLGILWTGLSDRSEILYRGGFATEAVAVAIVIAAAVQPARTMLRRALSVKPLRAVGWISYGLYLWHWPIYVFLSPERSGLEGTQLVVVRLAVTTAVSIASYVLVEMPVRRGALKRHRSLARTLVPLATAVVIASLVLSTSDIAGLGERRNAAARTQDVVDVSKTRLARQRVQQARAAAEATTINALVAGDSVSLTLAASYGPQLQMPNLAVQGVGTPGCGIARGRILPESSGFTQNCDGWPEKWQAGMDQFHPDVAVLLIGAWEVFDRQVNGQQLTFGTPEYAAYLRGELERGLGILTQFGAPVALLTMPCNNSNAVQRTFFDWDHRINVVNGILRDFAAAHPTQIVTFDLKRFLCPLSKWDHELDGAPVLPDGMHFSQASGEIVWRWLGPKLIKLVTDRRVAAATPTTTVPTG